MLALKSVIFLATRTSSTTASKILYNFSQPRTLGLPHTIAFLNLVLRYQWYSSRMMVLYRLTSLRYQWYSSRIMVLYCLSSLGLLLYKPEVVKEFQNPIKYCLWTGMSQFMVGTHKMRLLLPNSLGGMWRLGQWGSGHFVRLGHFCQANFARLWHQCVKLQTAPLSSQGEIHITCYLGNTT